MGVKTYIVTYKKRYSDMIDTPLVKELLQDIGNPAGLELLRVTEVKQ